jgi:FlaG/FlaF family flagellin (archaellin)
LKLGRARQGQPRSPTLQAAAEKKRKRENRLKAVRCRRGISNIIGELLVLAIVVGLMTGVIVFYNGVVNPIQQDYKSTAQQAEDSLKERFLIEDVQFFTQLSVKKMNVTIFNFGDISISIVRATVYINGTMKSIDDSSSSPISVNQSGWFILSYDWSPGGIYHVKVVTEGGTASESAFNA